MKVRLIGDIHGDFVALENIIKDVDYSIQVGDYGIGFGNNPPAKTNHRFIRGNHDNLTECKDYHNFIPDGTVEDTGYNKIMFVGGAWSIDRAWRTEGVDWWADEEVSYSRANELIDLYEQIKPDIMITHDIPRTISMKIFNHLHEKNNFMNITNGMFESMFSIHKPKLWFFGHWHQNRVEVIDGCRFMCLGINSYVDIDL